MSAGEADRKVNLRGVRCLPGGARRDLGTLRSPQERIDAASVALRPPARLLRRRAAQMRNEDAIGIYEAESMSLAGLASLIHVTKAGAHQIVAAHRKASKQTAEVAVPEVESPSKPEQQAIVAAVVTNGMAVLVGRAQRRPPSVDLHCGQDRAGRER